MRHKKTYKSKNKPEDYRVAAQACIADGEADVAVNYFIETGLVNLNELQIEPGLRTVIASSVEMRQYMAAQLETTVETRPVVEIETKTSRAIDTKHSKLVPAFARSALAAVTLGTTGCGSVGIAAGELSAHMDAADYEKQAVRYERCLSMVERNTRPGSKTVIVRLGTLSEQDKIDCDLSEALEIPDERQSYFYEHKIDGGLVVTDNSLVQLPTSAKLRELIGVAHEKRENVGHEGAFILGSAFMMVGLVGSLMGWMVKDTHRMRRERAASEHQQLHLPID